LKPYFVFALLGFILYLGIEGLYFLNWIETPPSYTLEIILFLFFITSLIYRYIFRFTSKGPEVVSQFYLFSIAIKLLGGCSFIAAIIILDKPNMAGNVALFLTAYIVFTAAEIAFLIHLKKA
jgi:hypothetical protein